MEARVLPNDNSPSSLNIDFSGKSDIGDTFAIIKEEELDFDDAGVVPKAAAFVVGGRSSSTTKSTLSTTTTAFAFDPKPISGLNDSGPPPFLTKTFDMVEDPDTDPIVSWSEASNSFVVWDPHNFSVNLLPKYFKHSNFSSFIRQLNTYGFRKIHLDRWEFANMGFQRGKKHLLKTIKRRSHAYTSTTSSSNNNHNTTANNKRLIMEKTTEIERLKDEHEMLRVEILNLKLQQETNDKHVSLMEDRIESAEWKQRQMLMLIAKAMKKDSLVKQMLCKYNQRRRRNNNKLLLGIGTVSKKRRLMTTTTPGQYCPSNIQQQQENMAINMMMESEMNSLLCSVSDRNFEGESDHDLTTGHVPEDDQYHNATDFTTATTSDPSTSPDPASSSYIMWEKLMEDDVICENYDTTSDHSFVPCAATQSQSNNIVNELEDLISRPIDWTPCNRDMVGGSTDLGCLGTLA